MPLTSKLVNIADAVRDVTGESDSLTLEDMKTKIDEVGEEVITQTDLISQIQAALQDKISGGNTSEQNGYSFFINGTKYYIPELMTWGEYIDSSYCTINDIYTSGLGGAASVFIGDESLIDDGGGAVSGDSMIKNNHEYETMLL